MSEPNAAESTDEQTVPWIVADFKFMGETWLVVLWPDDHGERWQVYLASFPWYWKSQPHEDRRV